MTESNGQEMVIAVLVLIAWCIIIIKLVDTWANKQYHDLRKISRNEIQTVNRELIAQVQSNTTQVEKMHRLLELRLLELDARLEGLMDNSRQISTIDVRTIEIARSVRKIDSMEPQLGEVLRNSRHRTYFKYMLKDHGYKD